MIELLAAAVAGLTLVGAGAARALLRRRYLLVTVRGNSMSPTYADGDLLLARQGRHLRRGQAVVFAHPLRTPATEPAVLVKRVRAVSGDEVPADLRTVVTTSRVPVGQLLVRGDNPVSLDSRRLGFVPESSVTAVVVRRIRSAHPTHPATHRTPAPGTR
ncbi:S26 family signal peptidase [Plantactinospora sp. GCM10030261]|uniref:S26 family signal peptidase n=1 Tax=Plantactinospora sp. GCM10030261 TaxID=3273420 RepID=UPI0036198374